MSNNDPQLQLLEQIALSLEELVKLTRITSYPVVRQVLETALDTDQKKLVYHFLDGTRKVAEIRKIARVQNIRITEWTREWERLGIVEPISARRYQRVYDISMFGIPIPPVAVNGNDVDNADEKEDELA